MTDKLLELAQREYPAGQRLLAFIPEGLFFLGLLPALLVRLSRRIDRRLGLPRLGPTAAGRALGGIMVAAGWLVAAWTIAVQFVRGRGTPVPAMATQELVVDGPYAYSRNPMVLGTIVMYAGVAVRQGSLAALGLVAAGAAALLAYVRGVEEKEMEARFGQGYVEYRARTPFLIPRLPTL